MRIGINGYLAARAAGGLARQQLVLLHGLRALEADHEYVVFSDRPLPPDLAHPRLRSRVFAWPRYILWEQLGLPAAMASERLDVFFGPAYGLPLVSRVPSVVMVHDVSFRRFPEMFGRKKRGYYQLMVAPALRQARRVVTPSQSTAADTRSLLGVPRERIDVVLNAVESRFRPMRDHAALSAVRQEYALPERFILYVGTIEPRKNLERLVEAYALARKEMGVDIPLVLAGGLGWLYAPILSAPGRFGVEQHVHFAGFVDDPSLPALYNAAELFVYPSLYEGFGLPVLEAMACGIPVVTTTASALTEVAGDAALLADPLDVRALATEVARGLQDPGVRARLQQAGPVRAAEFTPRAQAHGTLASLARAAGVGPR